MIRFTRLIITERAAHNDLGQELARAFVGRGEPVEIRDSLPIGGRPQEPGALTALYADAAPAAGWFRLAEHGTLFVRPGEHYLLHASGCQFDCDYCYLRASSGLRPAVVYTNFQAMFAELSQILSAAPPDVRPFVNAGEYADSLIAVPDFTFVVRLVEEIPRVGGSLELRTKSGDVGALLGLDHYGHTTVAFSLSPEPVVTRHERRTGSLAARIAAAAAAQTDGYRVSFKLEPILTTPTWEADYAEIMRQLRDVVDPAGVDHISVGTLRWGAALGRDPVFSVKMRAYQSQPDAVAYRSDVVNYTVPKEERIDIYRRMLTLLGAHGFSSPTYLSLESPDIVRRLVDEYETVAVAHA